ncbi:MAG: hypothetical protein KC502_08520 [Myxococcales bacterium]|nr:hypothetical protein [Myxococcales bacterium]
MQHDDSTDKDTNRQVGLDPDEAQLAIAAMAVATDATKPDRLFWVIGVVAAALLGVLALGAAAQARFSDSLTFLHQSRSVPEPLYAASWTEPPRTLDDIIASIKAER